MALRGVEVINSVIPLLLGLKCQGHEELGANCVMHHKSLNQALGTGVSVTARKRERFAFIFGLLGSTVRI